MKMLFAALALAGLIASPGLCGTPVLSVVRLPNLTVRQLRSTGRALLRLTHNELTAVSLTAASRPPNQ